MDDIFRKFQWQDRAGLIWLVGFYNDPGGFRGYATPRHERGSGKINVQTTISDSERQSMAFLIDVEVDGRNENRGLGSMLVRKSMEECRKRGHQGIYGYLSEVDADHFLKLKHFYEKLGLSVVFYGEEHPDYRFNRAGKIDLVFGNTSA